MKILNKISSTIIFIILFISTSIAQHSYQNLSSSQADIDFYQLQLKQVEIGDGTIIEIFIPKAFEGLKIVEKKDLSDNTVFYFEYFDGSRVLEIFMETLRSKNTIKFDTDKDYIDITVKFFKDYMNGDLDEISKLMSPIMKNCKVIDFKNNIIIHNKYYGRRTSYYNDQRYENTVYEKAISNEIHYYTLYDKTKYELFIKYTGNDKAMADLVGLFSTIAGSLKFKQTKHELMNDVNLSEQDANRSALIDLIKENKKIRGLKIDNRTVFDSSYIQNNTFIFSYSISNHVTESPSKIDMRDKIFEKIMQEALKNIVNLETLDYKVIHDAKMNIVFEYFSDDHREKIAVASFERTKHGFQLIRPESEWNAPVDLLYKKMLEASDK